MSGYGQRDPYFRPDPYASRSPYRRDRGYYWTNRWCDHCGRSMAFIGAGRSDPAIEACSDCGTEARFV